MEQMLKDPQHGISQHTTDLIHKVFGTDLTQLLLEHLPEASPTLRYGILTALSVKPGDSIAGTRQEQLFP